jgi:hypothetical protein
MTVDGAPVAQYKGRSETRASIHSFIYSLPIREAVNITDDTSRDQQQCSADWPCCPVWTGCSTSRGSAALSIRSASSHHSNGFTTATSRNPGTSPAGSIHHEHGACRRAHRHKPLHGNSLLIKTQTMAYLPTLYI